MDIISSNGAEELTLCDCLKMFNRKERYWLIQNALGGLDEKGSIKQLPISYKFLKKIKDSLKDEKNVVFPKNRHNIWWAMDYHLNWIVGALYLLKNGTPFKDNHNIIIPNISAGSNKFSLIESNQEDVDFIIAFDNTIILIEAKGVESWNTKQYERKCERITLIKEVIERSELRGKINVYFVLFSPKEPERLTKYIDCKDCQEKANKSKNMANVISKCNKPCLKPKHINMIIRGEELILHDKSGKIKGFYTVTRYNGTEEKSESNTQWRIEPETNSRKYI